MFTRSVYLVAHQVQQSLEHLQFLLVLVFARMNQVCHGLPVLQVILLVHKEMEGQRILDIRWPLFGLEDCWALKTINSL